MICQHSPFLPVEEVCWTCLEQDVKDFGESVDRVKAGLDRIIALGPQPARAGHSKSGLRKDNPKE